MSSLVEEINTRIGTPMFLYFMNDLYAHNFFFSQVQVSSSLNPFATGKEAANLNPFVTGKEVAASLNPFSSNKASEKDLNPFNT